MPSSDGAGNWKCTRHRPPIGRCSPSWRVMSPDWLIDVVVFPPHVYLADAVRVLRRDDPGSARRMSVPSPGGPLYGPSGRGMLGRGCSYVIVGHSGRRRWYQGRCLAGASLRRPAGTLRRCRRGETPEERGTKQTEWWWTAVDAVIAMHGGGGFADAVLAYEPVWAIGTAAPPRPEQARQHAFRAATPAHDAKWRTIYPYGGSVCRQCRRAIRNAGWMACGWRFLERGEF